MLRNTIFWVIAFVITLASAYYQRITGPTYPLEMGTAFAGEEINYSFERSHSGFTNHSVKIRIIDQETKCFIRFKRYKSYDSWSEREMRREGNFFTGELPAQPPAGKVEYYLVLRNNNQIKTFPEDRSILVRFKGDVPAGILIPHIILIFLAMLLSVRTGLEVFSREKHIKKYTIWTLSTLFLGGLLFGPLTQLYAFGALWTGFPFGYDLTDNKTLIAFIGWLAALFAIYKLKNFNKWVIAASVLMLVIFLIPHSVLGSEIDYTKTEKNEVINQLK